MDFYFFFLFHRRQFVSLTQKKKNSTISYLAFVSGSEICTLKMQVCYFRGVMCKVDWQKHFQPRKPSVVATPSHYQPVGCQSQRSQTGGKEFRERSTPPLAKLSGPTVDRTQMYSPDILCKELTERRRVRNDSEKMREPEKQCKTGSSIFSKAQHPAARSSLSLHKKDRVFVKYTSFSAQGNMALMDGRRAMQERQIYSLYHRTNCSYLTTVRG